MNPRRVSEPVSTILAVLCEVVLLTFLADRKFGWSPRGVPIRVKQDLRRSKRWSILPAFTIEGYIEWEILHGAYNVSLYDDFIRRKFLPLCTPGNGPRSVLVMETQSIHRSNELKDMCAEAGVELAFLPPYSPDFNPIETSSSVLKAFIKKNYELVAEYTEAVGGFGAFLNSAMKDQARSGEPGNLFRACGIHYISRNHPMRRI